MYVILDKSFEKNRKMGVADHARCESRRIFSYFIYITSGLSYHLQQQFSKNTLPCTVQPISDRRQTDRQTTDTDRRKDTRTL